MSLKALTTIAPPLLAWGLGDFFRHDAATRILLPPTKERPFMNTMSLELIAEFISVIAADLADAGILSPVVNAVLSAGAALIRQGDQGAAALQELTTQVKTMVNAGRDPTESEWDDLRMRSQAAHVAIQQST